MSGPPGSTPYPPYPPISPPAPPQSPQGGSWPPPPQPYQDAQWGQQPPPSTQPIPSWIDAGSILVLVGGILVLIGFMLEVSLIASTNYANAQAIGEATDSLLGVGFFLAALGWFIHQRYLFQRLAH